MKTRRTDASRLRRVVALCLAGALIVHTANAVAEPDPMDREAMTKRGLELYEAQNYNGAIEIWKQLVQSLGEPRAYKVLYNLGLAYQRIGDPTRAIDAYEAFLRRAAEQSATGAGMVERVRDAEERLRALKSKYGALRVFPPPAGGMVFTRVDTAEPRAGGYKVYLAPGRHEIELYSGTARARRQSVDIVAGETFDVPTADEELRPRPAPAANGLVPAVPVTERDSSFPTILVVLGVGATVAAGVVTAVLGVSTSNKRSTADALGAGNPDYATARSDFERSRTVYEVSYVAPAVFATATIGIVVWSLTRSSPRPASARVPGILTGTFP